MTTYTDKQLTQRFSFLHFAFFAEYSGCGFISFLLMQKTIGTAMIGIIAALTYLASTLIQPVWGILCDKYSCHRVFYWIGGIAGPLIYLTIILSDALWVLILCGLLSGMFLQALQNMSTGWIAGLNNEGYQVVYGKTRSFGSLAFALASLVYGRAVLHFGNTAIPAIMAVLGLVTVYAYCRIPKVSAAAQGGGSGDGAQANASGLSLAEGIRMLLKQKEYVIFVAACFLAVMGFAGTSTYHQPFLTELGANSFHIGLSDFTYAMAEVPFMFLFAWLVKKLGFKPVFLICLVSNGLMSLCVAMSHSVATAILALVFQGPSFGLVVPCVQYYAANHVDPRYTSTAQLFSTAIILSASIVAGNFLSGLLSAAMPLRTMFFCMAGISFIGLFLFVISDRK